MPRYFFDYRDNEVPLVDREGADVADFEQARQEAFDMLAEMARNKPPDGDHRVFTVTVRDDHREVYRVTLTLHGERLA